MKIDALDKKKGMSLTELKAAVDRLYEGARTIGEDVADKPVRVWVNISAGVKTLEF
jgi:hypothetical protein